MAVVNLGRVVGRSAYEEAVRLGYKGTVDEWMESINGRSAYQLAQKHGYQGTEDEWLESLNGTTAYESAVSGGYVGSEQEFNMYIASLGDINAILDAVNGEVV